MPPESRPVLQIQNVVKLPKTERWKTRAERHKAERWKMGLSVIPFVKPGTKQLSP